MILTFQISSYFVRTEIQVITWGKRTHRTLFQILVELTVLNILLEKEIQSSADLQLLWTQR